MKRAAILAAGWLFVVLGVVGLFLPILQGVLFLLIGLIILSSEYVWAHKLLRRILDRYPRLETQVEHARQRVHAWKEKMARMFASR